MAPPLGELSKSVIFDGEAPMGASPLRHGLRRATSPKERGFFFAMPLPSEAQGFRREWHRRCCTLILQV